MGRGVLAALALLCSAPCAAEEFPADHPAGGYWGNTMVFLLRGREEHLWFNRDGTYREFGLPIMPETDFHGTYAVRETKDGKGLEVCMQHIAPDQRFVCHMFSVKTVGDVWSDPRENDERTYRLLTGHIEEKQL